MRAALIAALCCSCSRSSVPSIKADDAHIGPDAAQPARGACLRVIGTWKLEEESGASPRSIEISNSTIVQRLGIESVRKEELDYRVVEATAEACRIRTQTSAMVLRPVAELLEIEAEGIVSRWVRAAEPLPSPP